MTAPGVATESRPGAHWAWVAVRLRPATTLGRTLAYPEVAFRVLSGGSETFSSPGTGSLVDAAVAVFGREVARHLPR